MMQGAAAGGAAQVGKPAGPTDHKPSGQQDQKPPSAFRPLLIALAGAIITGGVVAASLGGIGSASKTSGTAGGAELTLAKVASGEIAQAMVTLDPQTSQGVVEDAKACRAPMAWVTLSKQPGSAAGTVRIRSGSYLSPAFLATEAAQRIALPYPGPYASGHGVLWAVGEGSGLAIDLYPRWNIPSLNGATPINVIWTPTDPC